MVAQGQPFFFKASVSKEMCQNTVTGLLRSTEQNKTSPLKEIVIQKDNEIHPINGNM